MSIELCLCCDQPCWIWFFWRMSGRFCMHKICKEKACLWLVSDLPNLFELQIWIGFRSWLGLKNCFLGLLQVSWLVPKSWHLLHWVHVYRRKALFLSLHSKQNVFGAKQIVLFCLICDASLMDFYHLPKQSRIAQFSPNRLFAVVIDQWVKNGYIHLVIKFFSCTAVPLMCLFWWSVLQTLCHKPGN